MKVRSGIFTNNYLIQTKKPWPDDTSAQCGGGEIDGIGKNCFIEIYFKDFYVRGEALNIVDAENKAWEQYQLYVNCDHEFKRFSDKNTLGQCVHCKMKKSGMFEILTCCEECGIVGASHYINGHYCYKHFKLKLKEKISNNNKDEISSNLKNLWRNDVLEEVVDSENMTDYEIFENRNKSYSGFFEYMLETCKNLQSKYFEKPNKHYVDLYEDIEVDEQTYKSAYRVYLEDNKGYKFENIDDSRNKIINFIKNNG